ncbi:MAG: diacylglycerol kinase family lipid kinase [Erysipelothrix sp.]|jgi:YegS/Rv2252/BmrU family lipid kinase|nr:diacylglycerol kinase family lipid kinase [Erysipelothrix sp.]
MNHIFIINPASGSKKSVSLVEDIHRHMGELKEPYEIIFTEYAGHATEIAANYHDTDTCVYAVGGDGTAYEVLNGLQENVCMAIIPAGTGNDFYRMLDLGKDLKTSLRDTIFGREVLVDYAVANGRKFINMMAMGLDAYANQVAQNIAKKLPLPRALVYVVSALIAIANPKKIDIEASINGEVIKKRIVLSAIMNGKWYGGGFTPTPDASIQDGKLDICLVDDCGLFRKLQLLPMYSKGTHVNEKEVSFYQTDEFTLVTKELAPLSIDGEVGNETSLHVKMIKQQLRMRVPQASALQ